MTEDRRLVELFLDGRDELAFRRLYRRHTPYLYGMARRLAGGSADDCDDLVEETWIRAVRALGRFRWSSKLRTWLAGILVNCHREAVRRRASARTVDLEGLPLRSREPPAGLALELEEAVAGLSDGYREVFVLYHVYGFKHREIADLLGISVGTSKSQLSRGIARLRDLLR